MLHTVSTPDTRFQFNLVEMVPDLGGTEAEREVMAALEIDQAIQFAFTTSEN